MNFMYHHVLMRMNKLLLLVVMTISVWSSSCAENTSSTVNNVSTEITNNDPIGSDVGNQAPNFVLETQTSQTLELKSLRGKVVLLDFWASWCPKCQAKFPDLVSLYAKLDKSKVEFVGLSIDDTKQEMNTFLGKNPFTWKFVYQGPVNQTDASLTSSKYRVFGPSYLLVLDKKGSIVWRGTSVADAETAIASASK